MNDTLTPKPEPAARRGRANQDQALANRINQYRNALAAVQANAELGALLAPRGYDAAAIAAGVGLCDAAQTGFNVRQEAQAGQLQASVAMQSALKAARAGFDDFRKIARAIFKTDPAAQSALGATGRLPDDREKFQTAAAAAYAVALGHDAYLTALGKRGFGQAALAAEQVKLAALTQANAANETAQAAARRATIERDAAAKSLDGWWAEFRVVARIAFKDRPDLAGALGL